MLTSDISSGEQQQTAAVDCCSHAPSTDLSAGAHQHHGHHHHNTASPAAGVEDSCLTGSACQDAAQLAKAKKQRRKQVDRACNNCRRSKTACSIERPCKRCCTHGLQDSCFDAPRKRRSKKNKLSPEDQYLWHEMGKFLAEEGSIAIGLPEGVTDAGIKKKKGRKPRKSLKLQKLQLQLAQQQSQQYDQLNDSEDSSESIDILGGSDQYPSNNNTNNSNTAFHNNNNNNNNNGHSNFSENPYDPLQSADFFNESSPLQLLKSIDPNLDFNQFLSEICPGMSNFEFSPQQLQCLDLLSSDSSNDFFSSSPFSLPQTNSDDSSSQLSTLQQSVSSLATVGQQQPGQVGYSDSFSQLSSSFGSSSDSDDGFFGEDSNLSNYHDSVSLDLSSSSSLTSSAGAPLSRFMPDSATCHSTISPAALSNSTWSPHHLHNQQHQFHHHQDVLRVD